LGLYPRGFIYTSAVHLYLRSIFTAGVPGFVFFAFPCSLPLFITPLDSHLREILYDTNKYSNSLQSLTILFLDLGINPRGFIYTSAVYLYLRSIFTAGVPGFVFFAFPCSLPLFITPLDSHLREILYDTNKYSNSLQSREILLLDLGLDPARVYIYFRRLSLPTVHFYGPPGSSFSRSIVLSLFITPLISHLREICSTSHTPNTT
jgi:hypothetical protein